jgi:histidinol-phosphatase (PHP family)
MQNFNYHCHTNFNNIFDGDNSAEDMITRAEQLGFETLGISNHCIFHHSFAQMPFMHTQNFSDYKRLIDVFKRCYAEIDEAASRHHIKILKGMEVDFFPSAIWRNEFEQVIKEVQPDYMISATHFIRPTDESALYNIYHLEQLPSSLTREDILELLKNYWRNIKMSIESGYFNFLAHMDYCCQFHLCEGPEWQDVKEDIVETLYKHKMPCEINTGGLRRTIGRPFPNWDIVERLVAKQIPVLISDDSHRIEDMGTGFDVVEAKLAELNCQKRFSF